MAEEECAAAPPGDESEQTPEVVHEDPVADCTATTPAEATNETEGASSATVVVVEEVAEVFVAVVTCGDEATPGECMLACGACVSALPLFAVSHKECLLRVCF